MTKKILVGAHMSIAKSLHLAFERGESIGCTAMQIFTKSCRIMFGKPIEQEEVRLFKEAHKNSNIQSVIVHAGYLINLCTKGDTKEKQATAALEHELDRCTQLGLPYLVLHPGSHLGAGEQAGIENIARNLDHALEKTKDISVLLETMAGQGTGLGHTFEQLNLMRSSCDHKKRIGFCLDTCHIFAAGYNLSDKEHYKKVFDLFDDTLGLSHLKAIHLNDSKTEAGSRVDRHAPIGEGKIPLEIFQQIMNDKHLVDIPKILETPTDTTMHSWQKEIALLESFVQ